jgi:hypothetical protein
MMAEAGYNLKHWLNKVIFALNLIHKILTAELLEILTGYRNRHILISVMANCENRGVWQA